MFKYERNKKGTDTWEECSREDVELEAIRMEQPPDVCIRAITSNPDCAMMGEHHLYRAIYIGATQHWAKRLTKATDHKE